jgi:hypothetical protein
VAGLKDIAFRLRLRFCLQQRRTALSGCSRGKNPCAQDKKDYGCAKNFNFRSSPPVCSFDGPFWYPQQRYYIHSELSRGGASGSAGHPLEGRLPEAKTFL